MSTCRYRGLTRFQETEQEQHPAHEQEDVDGISNVVPTEDADQPHGQQTERNFQQHLASEPQPASRDRQSAAEELVREIPGR
jgi:hypothetical protein